MTENRPLPSAATVHGIHAVFFALMFGGLYAIGVTMEVLRETGWWLPFLTVHVGIFAGNIGMAALFQGSDAAAEIAAQGRREDLLDSRQVVVEQLRNLEAEKEKLSAEDYERERSQLVSVGAMAARELQEGPGLTSEAAATPDVAEPAMLGKLRALRDEAPAEFDAALASMGLSRTSGGMSGEWRGAAYAFGMVGLAALMFTMAGEGSRDRRAGETMTGGDQTMREDAPPSAVVDPRVAQLKQQITADPSNIELLNQLTELALSTEDVATAMEANRSALELSPQDPGARTYKAVLLAFIRKHDEAFQLLDEVIASHPAYAKSHVYKGLLNLSRDPSQSVKNFEAAIAIEDSPELQQALARARMLASTGGAPPPQAPPPQPAGGEVLAEGTITLGEGVEAKGTTLFVFARKPGTAGGPPMIALKLAPTPFPQTFKLTKANMLPMFARMPLPDTLDIGVRLDADGDAASRADGEPTGSAQGVKVGTTGLTIELK